MPAKKIKANDGTAQDATIVFDLQLLKEAEHQKHAITHAKTALADVPDDALAAECARRNLQIVAGTDGADAVEKLIDERYKKLRMLGQGSSGTVYEASFICTLFGKSSPLYLQHLSPL